MAKKKELGMKWFHFLIYFVLWFNAFVCAVVGAAALSFPVNIADTAYGAAMLVFAVFCLITRSRLAKFKKGAPGCLHAFYILGNIVIDLAYNIAFLVLEGALSELPTILLDPQFIGILVGTIIIVSINKTYFGKRKHLFVN